MIRNEKSFLQIFKRELRQRDRRWVMGRWGVLTSGAGRCAGGYPRYIDDFYTQDLLDLRFTSNREC